jgi:hypothetical protein
VSDLASALLDELTGDPAELDRLADALAERVAARAAKSSALDQSAVVKVPTLLPVPAVAKILGVSPDTVHRRIAEGTLPAVLHDGKKKVRGDELRAYIDGLERSGRRPGRASRAQARRRYDFLHSG